MVWLIDLFVVGKVIGDVIDMFVLSVDMVIYYLIW